MKSRVKGYDASHSDVEKYVCTHKYITRTVEIKENEYEIILVEYDTGKYIFLKVL